MFLLVSLCLAGCAATRGHKWALCLVFILSPRPGWSLGCVLCMWSGVLSFGNLVLRDALTGLTFLLTHLFKNYYNKSKTSSLKETWTIQKSTRKKASCPSSPLRRGCSDCLISTVHLSRNWLRLPWGSWEQLITSLVVWHLLQYGLWWLFLNFHCCFTAFPHFNLSQYPLVKSLFRTIILP